MRRFVFLLLVSGAALHADAMRYSDVNANLWTISGRILVFDPVKPVASSSGTYSGGVPRAVILDSAAPAAFEALCRKARAATSAHLSRRERLSVVVHCGGNDTILKSNSPEAMSLEKELKRLLASGADLPRQYEIERSSNPWQGLTSTSQQEERNKTIRAAPVKSGLAAVPGPSGRSFLYRDNQAGEVVVDAKFFETLKRPDATRVGPGESFEIGRAKTDEVLNPAVLIPFLLLNQIVITYWHTGAEVRLDAVEDDGRCFLFSGEHTYYTNEKNTEPLRFQICVKDRMMILSARR